MQLAIAICELSLYDMFSVIKFGSEAVTVIDPVSVLDANMDEVEQVVMSLSDGGGTNFDNALRECINGLKSSNVDYDDYNNIIVFLSDGGSEVSDSLLEELSDKGIRIAAIALGSGSDSERMKHLSDSTNGQYIYAESSEALDTIFDAIQGSLIGVDATDTDGDGIPDIIEVTGMKNQYGAVIRTDPYEYDTDGDGDSDGEEMGSLVETDEVTDMDRANGITKNVYFQMVSNPLDGVRDTDFKLDDERTLGEFSGLPGHLTLTAGDEHWIELNRANAKLSIDDESIATIEPGIDVGNIDGTVSNWTNFKICPKESGEATLTATAPNGQKLKCKLTVNAKVELKAESSGIDDTGHFTLTFHLDTVGTSKKLYVEFVCAECISWWMAHDEYNFTDHNGKIYKPTLAEGNYDVTVDMTCLVGESGADCDNSHDITVKVFGDNFVPCEKTVHVQKDFNTDDNNSDNIVVPSDDEIKKFEHELGNYLIGLNNLNSEGMNTKEDSLKQEAMNEVRKIDFDEKFLNNGFYTNIDKNERLAMKECFYMAMFDNYMTAIYDDNMGFLGSDKNKKYFDNISAADFSDGGVSATTSIVKGADELIKDLITDETFKNKYTYKRYTYDVEMKRYALTSYMMTNVKFTNENGRTIEYNNTLGNDGVKSAEQKRLSYVEELSKLYEEANRCAVKEAISAINEFLPNIVDESFTGANAPINMSAYQKSTYKDFFKKLDKKTINALKECGLADINEFLGACLDGYKVAKEFGSLTELLQSGDTDNISKLYNQTEKSLKELDECISDNVNGKCSNASTIVITEAQAAVKKALEAIKEKCEEYINEHYDDFKKWWEFWK